MRKKRRRRRRRAPTCPFGGGGCALRLADTAPRALTHWPTLARPRDGGSDPSPRRAGHTGTARASQRFLCPAPGPPRPAHADHAPATAPPRPAPRACARRPPGRWRVTPGRRALSRLLLPQAGETARHVHRVPARGAGECGEIQGREAGTEKARGHARPCRTRRCRPTGRAFAGSPRSLCRCRPLPALMVGLNLLKLKPREGHAGPGRPRRPKGSPVPPAAGGEDSLTTAVSFSVATLF
ncbi:uncharacterized protein ACBT57_006376 [Dama dama]